MQRVSWIPLYDEYCLGIRYMSSVLQEAGHESHIIIFKGVEYISPQEVPPLEQQNDGGYYGFCTYTTKQELGILLDLLREQKPDLVGMSFSSVSFGLAQFITKHIQEELGIKVMWGGVDATINSNENIKYCDFLCTGEGEFPVLNLVNQLDKGIEYPEVESIWVRKENGDICRTPTMTLEKNLDNYPFPDFELENKSVVIHNSVITSPPYPPKSHLYSNFIIMATRGCPFTCTFCAWPQIMYNDNKYRKRNPVNVVDEVEAMKKEYGFRSFYFDDDTFNIGKKRILALCEEISRRDLKMPWAAMSRADTSDRETLREMKRSGLQGIKFGVESGSQELVDNAKKSLDLDRVVEACAITRELGIRTHLTFSFGLPGETWETVRKTINFAKQLDPDTLQFSLMTPFPGSTFYEEMKEKNMLLTGDWSQYDGGTTSVVHTDELSGHDLEKALRMAYNEWDMHKLIRPFRDFRTLKRVMSQPRQTLHTLGFLAKRHLRRVIHAGA